MPSLSFTWHWEVLFPAVLLAIAVWALIEAQNFAIASSKFLPTWMALVIIPLLVIQIIGRLLSPHAQGEIMDLGMRTGTGFDAVKRLAYVFSWLAGYILAIGIFGMEYASIAFAFGFAVFTLDWNWPKKLWSILPAAIIAAVIFGFFNPVMFTQWPDLIIVDFFRGLG